MLGGVCAGIARSAGLDPLLLRIAVVAVTVLTGGAGVPAYLAAWVLIPREPLDADTGGTGRAAGRGVGRRRPGGLDGGRERPAVPHHRAAPACRGGRRGSRDRRRGADRPRYPRGEPGAIPAPRSPLAAADDAATALGDRLRTPEVQAGARKAAASVTQAVTASVDELARRVRRDRS